MKKLISIVTVISFILLLASCKTGEQHGTDIEVQYTSISVLTTLELLTESETSTSTLSEMVETTSRSVSTTTTDRSTSNMAEEITNLQPRYREINVKDKKAYEISEMPKKTEK